MEDVDSTYVGSSLLKKWSTIYRTTYWSIFAIKEYLIIDNINLMK